ncbi:MAG: ribonuclease P protein component, partial [Candidatus Cloacimonetes bacterium]|nr:ribonuclease P protein component [Candidatus Cloacimonadota bacterium]
MRFITSRRDYLRILINPHKISGNLFRFFYINESPEQSLAVGIIVSRKVGKAVIRNKVKRRIRAYLRNNPSLWTQELSLIIRALPEAGDAGWQEISDDLS